MAFRIPLGGRAYFERPARLLGKRHNFIQQPAISCPTHPKLELLKNAIRATESCAKPIPCSGLTVDIFFALGEIRFDFASLNGVDECGVIALGLVSVAFRPGCQGLIEDRRVAAVACNASGITGARMST